MLLVACGCGPRKYCLKCVLVIGSIDPGLGRFDGFTTDLISENPSDPPNPWSIHRQHRFKTPPSSHLLTALNHSDKFQRGRQSTMSTIARFITEDELLRMPGGARYELIEGELREMSPTGYEHGRSTSNFSSMLWVHVRVNKLGDVLAAETGFLIARTADGRATVLAPDVSFVAKGRIPPDADTRRFLELAPDLVVETLSPSDTAREVAEKVTTWLKAGVRVVVTLDPDSRSVKVHRSQRNVITLSNGDELDLDDVVPGSRCRVSDIFD